MLSADPFDMKKKAGFRWWILFIFSLLMSFIAIDVFLSSNCLLDLTMAYTSQDPRWWWVVVVFVISTILYKSCLPFLAQKDTASTSFFCIVRWAVYSFPFFLTLLFTSFHFLVSPNAESLKREALSESKARYEFDIKGLEDWYEQSKVQKQELLLDQKMHITENASVEMVQNLLLTNSEKRNIEKKRRQQIDALALTETDVIAKLQAERDRKKDLIVESFVNRDTEIKQQSFQDDLRSENNVMLSFVKLIKLVVGVELNHLTVFLVLFMMIDVIVQSAIYSLSKHLGNLFYEPVNRYVLNQKDIEKKVFEDVLPEMNAEVSNSAKTTEKTNSAVDDLLNKFSQTVKSYD